MSTTTPSRPRRTFAGTVDHYQYSRFANPTLSMLEERLCLIEGAEACRTTATGMAAVNAALLAHLKAGDRVVASRALFGSCHWIVSTLLPKFGIATEFVDCADLAQWRAALSRPAQLVLLETPSNPMLELVDLRAVADLAHAAGAIVVVDNVFATPLLQQPLKFGADVVVYSCTKHIDGQGRVLGGAVLGSRKWITETLQPFIRNTGPAMSPFNAWVLLKGLETLALRVDAGCRGAVAIAEFLAARPEVTRVWYPTRADHPQQALALQQMTAGGTVVTFEVAGGKDAAFSVMNAFGLIAVSNNLGDSKSLVTHPATTTHMRIGAGGAREARHHRWCDPAVGRARGCRGPEGRSGAGAGHDQQRHRAGRRLTQRAGGSDTEVGVPTGDAISALQMSPLTGCYWTMRLHSP